MEFIKNSTPSFPSASLPLLMTSEVSRDQTSQRGKKGRGERWSGGIRNILHQYILSRSQFIAQLTQEVCFDWTISPRPYLPVFFSLPSVFLHPFNIHRRFKNCYFAADSPNALWWYTNNWLQTFKNPIYAALCRLDGVQSDLFNIVITAHWHSNLWLRNWLANGSFTTAIYRDLADR